jgi:hypothetical protein
MAQTQIKKVSFTHEAFANWLIEHPHRNLRDAALYFGYTQAWLSQILHSDAFQEVLRKKQALMTELVILDVHGKLKATADVALGKLSEQIEKSENGEFLLDATDRLLHRMGYAPSSSRNPGAINIQQTTVHQNIAVPASDLAAARAALLDKLKEQCEPPAIEGELIPREEPE